MTRTLSTTSTPATPLRCHPSLGRSRFWRDDVQWHGVGPSSDLSYQSHSLAIHLKGRSQGDHDMYVMINSYWESLTFVVQATPSGTWAKVIDTGSESPNDFLERGAEAVLTSTAYSVGPRSIVVLLDI